MTMKDIVGLLIAEYVAEEETTLRDQITKQKIRAEDGYLQVPKEPGLGIELDEEAVAKFRVA